MQLNTRRLVVGARRSLQRPLEEDRPCGSAGPGHRPRRPQEWAALAAGYRESKGSCATGACPPGTAVDNGAFAFSAASVQDVVRCKRPC